MRQFDFLGKTKIFLPISLVLIVISIILIGASCLFVESQPWNKPLGC